MYTVRNFVRPESLDQALAELQSSKHNRVIGGGLFLKLGHRAIGKLISLDGLGLDTITETADAIQVGGEVSLRDLETHPLILEYYPALSYAVSQIVGVQFRNLAKVGSSVFSRYGFSDIIPCLLAAGAAVRLMGQGSLTIDEFLESKRDWDILTSISLPKAVTVSYTNLRQAQGDFSTLNLAIGKTDNDVRIVYGARPMGAVLAKEASLAATAGQSFEEVSRLVQSEVVFGSNMRASADYRRHLAGVLLERLWEEQ